MLHFLFYVLDYFLYAFWILAFIAFISCAFAFHISSLSPNNAPIVSSGLGNNSAFFSLLSLFVFICGNLYSDRAAPPAIVSLQADQYVSSPRDLVALAGTASDDDGDHLIWTWRIAPPASIENANQIPIQGDLRTAQWIVPEDAINGEYRVIAIVNDGSRDSEPRFLTIRVEDGRDPDP